MNAPAVLRTQTAALYDTGRCLALIHIANLAYAVAAWAETRDLDQDWTDADGRL